MASVFESNFKIVIALMPRRNRANTTHSTFMCSVLELLNLCACARTEIKRVVVVAVVVVAVPADDLPAHNKGGRQQQQRGRSVGWCMCACHCVCTDAACVCVCVVGCVRETLYAQQNAICARKLIYTTNICICVQCVRTLSRHVCIRKRTSI